MEFILCSEERNVADAAEGSEFPASIGATGQVLARAKVTPARISVGT